MKNLMIDLETMSKQPDAAIVSIGAVFFTPETGELGARFYRTIDLASAIAAGGRTDEETIQWWAKQSQEARDAIALDTQDIRIALDEFAAFVRANSLEPYAWGNGASFDNVIVRGAFERLEKECPWPFWNDRDVRTMVHLGREVGFNPKRDMPFEGEAHNAMDDAIHQAKYVSAIWQKLLPDSPGPKNLDKALLIMGVAMPESREEFDLNVERWTQRLVDRVIRFSDELQEAQKGCSGE